MRRRLVRIGLWTGGVLAGFIVTIVVAAFVIDWTEGTETPNAGLAFVNPLRIPPLLAPTLDGTTRGFDLTVQSGETLFRDGGATATIGFNGSYSARPSARTKATTSASMSPMRSANR